SPSRRNSTPPMSNGPDHGARLSTAQVTASSDGAGSMPSVSTITETSSGTFTVKSRTPSLVYSPIQRSDPSGAIASSVFPLTSSLVSSLVSGSKVTWLYDVSPAQATRSPLRP